MDNTKKKERLNKHITALEESYGNLLLVLNKKVETDDNGEVKLSDTKKRLYSEGVQATAETATYILDLINAKQTELDNLDKEKDNQESETSKETESTPGYSMQKHLE